MRSKAKKNHPMTLHSLFLNPERKILYQRINERVDGMMDEGLVNEVISLKERGLSKDYISMQGIGYKEILEYLNGDILLSEAVDKIKKNTRHMAKRQVTWFKREKDIININPDEFENNEKIAEYMLERINNG